MTDNNNVPKLNLLWRILWYLSYGCKVLGAMHAPLGFFYKPDKDPGWWGYKYRKR